MALLTKLWHATEDAAIVAALDRVRSIFLALWDKGYRQAVHAMALVWLRIVEAFTSKYVSKVPVQENPNNHAELLMLKTVTLACMAHM